MQVKLLANRPKCHDMVRQIIINAQGHGTLLKERPQNAAGIIPNDPSK
jgi:hypothetical protein